MCVKVCPVSDLSQPAPDSPADRPWRRRGYYALHVAGLTCVAFAQPLFDLIGRHEEFLVAHQLMAPEIAAFAARLGRSGRGRSWPRTCSPAA